MTVTSVQAARAGTQSQQESGQTWRPLRQARVSRGWPAGFPRQLARCRSLIGAASRDKCGGALTAAISGRDDLQRRRHWLRRPLSLSAPPSSVLLPGQSAGFTPIMK